MRFFSRYLSSLKHGCISTRLKYIVNEENLARLASLLLLKLSMIGALNFFLCE